MHLPVSRPEGGPVDGETAAEYLGGLSSQVPAGHPHRRRRREHDHARPGPGKVGDRAGEFVERAVALDDPAEAERLQPPGSGRCGKLGPQRRQVEPDRLARAHLTRSRFPARTRILPRSWMLISNRLPSACPRSVRTGLTGPGSPAQTGRPGAAALA